MTNEFTNPLRQFADEAGIAPFMMTKHGVKIYYASVTTDNIQLRDIAYQLSHITRWVGSIGQYSVAQHSVLLARHALNATEVGQYPKGIYPPSIEKREAFARALLFHDAEEYITNDIPGPLKTFFPLLKEYGDYLRALIWRKYDIHKEWYPHCKEWDRRILFNEAEWAGMGRDGVTLEFGEGITPTLDLGIGTGWSPREAEQMFLDTFTRLA